jgi:hypothetical protein
LGNEIPEQVPQGEYREEPDGNSRNEEIANELRGRIEAAQKNVSTADNTKQENEQWQRK